MYAYIYVHNDSMMNRFVEFIETFIYLYVDFIIEFIEPQKMQINRKAKFEIKQMKQIYKILQILLS